MLKWLRKKEKEEVKPTPTYYTVKKFVPAHTGIMVFNDEKEFSRFVLGVTKTPNIVVDVDKNLFFVMEDMVVMCEDDKKSNNNIG